MFEVTRKKTGETCLVYSVQMMIGQSTLGQPAPVVVFLIHNAEKDRWELVEADEFSPIGVDSAKSDSKKVTILGADAK